jgi:saccharopine dehydrogenase-like NADP-dependent oxidoreductase
MKIAVLGAGMVGRAIALDLIKDHDVTSFDLAGNNLEELKKRNASIHVAAADLSDIKLYEDLLKPFDIIVSAVPGYLGYKTLEGIIHAGKDVVDISFFPEDVFQLNNLALQKQVTVIPDCGIAPGLSNFLLGK